MEDDLIFGDSFKQLQPSRIPFGCTTRYKVFIDIEKTNSSSIKMQME